MSLSNLTAPFDLVVFPSMGLFYKNKKQHILVRYLTGIEENILTSPMLDEYGIALDMALKNVVLDQDVNIDDLLVGDKNAILMPFLMTICPVSGSSSPLIMRIIWVFPEPFLAIKAIFWSLLIPKEMSLNNVRSPNDFDIFSTER